MVGSGFSVVAFAIRIVIEHHVRFGKLLICLNMIAPLRKYDVVISPQSSLREKLALVTGEDRLW
jgi:hypothetical protein